jgi:hypothetical protein
MFAPGRNPAKLASSNEAEHQNSNSLCKLEKVKDKRSLLLRFYSLEK